MRKRTYIAPLVGLAAVVAVVIGLAAQSGKTGSPFAFSTVSRARVRIDGSLPMKPSITIRSCSARYASCVSAIRLTARSCSARSPGPAALGRAALLFVIRG